MRMAASHPEPDEGGFACSPGQATEGSDTPGNAARDPRPARAKALVEGNALAKRICAL